ncbi:glycosyltransferase [Gephyromycinifex aptenodytis]|uniref:glycosyltransferase n=1 Tax=Gephyromycinifex aptenodytis TaxID=2716227 RepID=UPI001445D82F|nr:glycosyltransferase [Gephyromycinifex aptenodytis]
MSGRLLVASTGGHLEQLHRLEPRLRPTADRVAYATFEDQQSSSLLAGREVHYVPRIPPRGAKQALVTLPQAFRILKSGQFSSVVSTGSAIAIPFFTAARSLGIECHYVESSARVEGPSLTGRMMTKVPGVHLYAQYERWAERPWAYQGSVFDSFTRDSAVRPSGAGINRVVVTLGTMRGYPYRRAVDAVQRVLAEVAATDVSVLWQVGDTPVADLGLDGRFLVPAADLSAAIRDSDLVFAHAGVGSCLQILDAGRCPVLLPRVAARGEHIDDHQWMIADELHGRGLAVSRDADALTAGDALEARSKGVIAVTAPPFSLHTGHRSVPSSGSEDVAA